MELDKFIEMTLKQIIDGISNAQEYALTKGAKVNPSECGYSSKDIIIDDQNETFVQKIDFDIAIETNNSTGTSGGIGVVSGLVNLGSKGSSGQENSFVNKIKFNIPVTFPASAKLKIPAKPKQDW